MGNKYNPREVELKWQKYRDENQTYKFKNDESLPIYSIDTPPPTVSGKIHIGHIFSYSQAEVIARYKRMSGYNVFYPMGYDNNGIPTEQLVERELGINIKDVERKDFINKCLEVVDKYKVLYENLWRSLGISVDRTRFYTTISPEVQKISQSTFVKLYKEGQIVCKDFPALRCTKMQTTVAQAETEEQEFEEYFNYLNFTIVDDKIPAAKLEAGMTAKKDGDNLVIATTRPELLPACLAVFVHPDDERFQKYIGRKITTPIGVTVPLLADDKVKMDKGTGVVMCCSYGDEVDVFWINKHNLGEKVVIDRYGRMKDSGVPEIDGMKIKDARVKIMEIFESKGDIVVKRDPITQSKQISERGKVPVEIIPIKQWFVNLLDKKEILLAQNEKMRWFPGFMKKRSNDWIENLQRDWNISRSRKFGIPIPVRYDQDDNVILPSEEQLSRGMIDPSVDLPDGYTADQIRPETLIFDTWFTSGLTPYINQKFLERDGYKQNILPINLRPQSHDIIRTWLLYTTLHTYFRDGQKPFEDIMVSGFLLAAKGEKISKSKGNAKFDPESLIETRGADAVRYWALGLQLGKDTFFDENELKNGQKLVTKLWNAFAFVKMQLEGYKIPAATKITLGLRKGQAPEGQLLPTDEWILVRLQETITTMRNYLDKYEYGLAKIHFEDFFWKDFCDNYLEMVKVRLYKPELFENGEEKKKAAQYTLYQVYYAVIRLIAPYMPHVTEEIYQNYFKQFEGIESVNIANYPEIKDYPEFDNKDAIKSDFDKFLEIVEYVRKYKTEKQISMGAELEKLIVKGPNDYLDIIKKHSDDLVGVSKTKNIEWVEDSDINWGID
ncbi:valine--tRNA ligase [Candidatus Gracilibacteria bacterium]|nr:valine--tRNA ligase [Candidatus Gracilibacteria bacterium]